jgi:hypothetical protein
MIRPHRAVTFSTWLPRPAQAFPEAAGSFERDFVAFFFAPRVRSTLACFTRPATTVSTISGMLSA